MLKLNVNFTFFFPLQMSLWRKCLNPYNIDNTFNWIPHGGDKRKSVETRKELKVDIQLIPLSRPTQNSMTSASSMNHEIVKKSIKNQSKQRTDNGDKLRHTKHRNQAATLNTLRPFIPLHQSKIFTTIASTSRRSFWFYALSSVILALCFLPTIASVNITQPLPL